MMNHESHTVYIHIFIDFDLQQGLNMRLKSEANASDIWTVIIISTMEWNVALRPMPRQDINIYCKINQLNLYIIEHIDFHNVELLFLLPSIYFSKLIPFCLG